jgi:tRNA-specific 2-thiouridylase
MKKNEVYVTTDLQDARLWSDKIKFSSAHWIDEEPKYAQKLFARTRHRGKLIKVTGIKELKNSIWEASLDEEVRALAPGQSVVFYSESMCLGGGIITGV